MLEEDQNPTNENLKKVLGKLFRSYNILDGYSSEYKKEWNFYTRSGWLQKVHDGKKALYFLIPKEKSFLVNFTMREEERTEFMNQDELADVHELLANARKYPEGFAFSCLINDETSFSSFIKLMQKLIEKRGE
ncbi:MAG: DUF3788 family protein [Bacteroidetes bacterium]|nr:DUF3788 family protein [Bacteroidota bacterium]